MKDKTISSTGTGILNFYLFIIGSLVLSVAQSFGAYHAFSMGSPLCLIPFILSIALLYVSDIIAVPIQHIDGGIRFSHLWRKSDIPFDESRVVYIGTHFYRRFIIEEEDALLVLKRKNAWTTCFVICDKNNQLKEIYEKLY